VKRPLTTDRFIGVLERSTLGERRPIDDRACMEGAMANADLTVTAWDGASLVGVARNVTNFFLRVLLVGSGAGSGVSGAGHR
jgi:hypothetical protein